MRVTVDAALCQGHARCWDICPAVFTLDDDGFAVVHDADVPPELEGKVSQAAGNCPERAIAIG